MRIKTQELTGAALDWAVAKALGYKATVVTGQQRYDRLDPEDKADRAYSDLVRDSKPRIYWDNPTKHTPCPSFSGSWEAGGPIIERHPIQVGRASDRDGFAAYSQNGVSCVQYGPTPLIAAMRCFCAAKLGDEVDTPEELLK
jgi:hypothetical protein